MLWHMRHGRKQPIKQTMGIPASKAEAKPNVPPYKLPTAEAEINMNRVMPAACDRWLERANQRKQPRTLLVLRQITEP